MSDTPETDALWREMTTGNYQPSWWVAAERMRDHAKRVERQRDEVREVLQAVLKTGERLERERDEAREEIKELIYIAERAIALAEIDFENDKFGVVSELRDGVERIKEGAK
jgi:translation initiation factor 2 alpha subunit (eIF-2alpha)